MDCCNYLQPYPAHGHFYHQQQHHFCYDNANAYGAYGIGGGAGGAPVSDAIEANASRYNRLPPAYPTDYVYNPKEARLRKAMREQSRELSRQTILQTAIASANGNSSVGGPGCGGNGVSGNVSPSSATGATNFLNHPLNCPASVVAGSSIGAATVSSLPGSPSFNTGNRIVNPWFSGNHGPSVNHLKPILSPRVMTVAQHQQQQQQQQQQQHRTFDKTKEVLRKQAECVGVAAFSEAASSGYPPDFPTNGNSGNLSGHHSSSHETNDYCVIAEFSDGQKWHPYQNGPSPYYTRAGGPLTKMGAMHPGMQTTNLHAHSGWNQFCAVPLSNVHRAPRHMVFLQEQQQNQHCSFPDEMQIPYVQNKHMDVGHRLHTNYSQQDNQSKLPSSSMSPLNMSQLRETEKTIEDAPRWETSGPSSGNANESSISSMVMRARREKELKMNHEQERDQARVHQDCRQHSQQSKNRERDREQQRFSDETTSSSETIKHVVKSTSSISKQPLPGFHQAFGSTEIGRFSRSEFFANMVGDSGNVSSNTQNSCNPSALNNRTIDIVENCATSDLEDSSSASNGIIVDNRSINRPSTNVPCTRNRHNRREGNMDDCNSQGSGSNDNTEGVVINENESTSFNNSVTMGGSYYNDVRSPGPSVDCAIVGVTTMPRWHSPYVSAIGSEI